MSIYFLVINLTADVFETNNFDRVQNRLETG